MHPRRAWLLVILTGFGTALAPAQVTINLNSVIGPSGTNAASIASVGNRVNATGYGLDGGPTTLTATGSTGSSVFDFNTGFADSIDRATGSNAGAPNVYADLKYDSSVTGPLVLDTNQNAAFDDAPVGGFGMHGDTFITFDLAVIRTNAGLAANTAFTLTGGAGIANTTIGPTSAAIILDSAQLAVFDWTGPSPLYTTFNLSISGSARYLTFVGLSGTDLNNFYAHVGFGNVQLLAIPEPPLAALLGAGLAAVAGWNRWRRKRR